MARKSKAEAIRQARSLRAELLILIQQLESPGQPTDAAWIRASAIFEHARGVEYAVRALVKKGRNDV